MSAAATPKKVKVSMMNAIHDLPLLVARDEGFFADQGLDVDPDGGGRNQAEVGERRIAASDVGRIDEDATEIELAGESLQGRARIGHGNELLTVPDTVEEIGRVRPRLDRLSALARDDEERVREVDLLFEAADGGRVRTVEHMEGGEPFALPEGAAEDLGAEAASAHAQ